jgi:hypothetical protein
VRILVPKFEQKVEGGVWRYVQKVDASYVGNLRLETLTYMPLVPSISYFSSRTPSTVQHNIWPSYHGKELEFKTPRR